MNYIEKNSSLSHKEETLDDNLSVLQEGTVPDQVVDDLGPVIPKTRRDMRALAFHLIYAVDRFNYTVPLEEIIENFRTGFNVEIAPDALAISMAQGAVNQRDQLDEEIKPLLHNWKLERLGCCTRLILRLAIWEMHQPDAIPSVIINEAIELAKNFAEKDAYKFINGILDEASKKVTKKEDNDAQPD